MYGECKHYIFNCVCLILTAEITIFTSGLFWTGKKVCKQFYAKIYLYGK